MTPSRASGLRPRSMMAAESARWAAIGWDSPSIRHSIGTADASRDRRGVRRRSPRPAPTPPAAVLGRVDAAHEAAGQRFLGPGTRGRRAPTPAPADPDDPRQEPARRGLRHDAAAREHEADLAVVGAAAGCPWAGSSLTPTPTAGPLIAPITGLVLAKMRRTPPSAVRCPGARSAVAPCARGRRCRRRRRGRRPRRSRARRRSRSLPARRRRRRPESKASSSSCIIVAVKAFSCSGRLSVMMAAGPSIS